MNDMARESAPEIETERLLLRGLCERDFPVYERFFGDAEASATYGGPLAPGAAWRRLAADIGHWALRGYGLWAVTEKAGGRMAGVAGLYWPHGWPRSELTWWIAADARRNGYALEASRAVIAFAYRELGWTLVETHMNDTNTAARNLALRLGGQVIAREMFPDGVERNVYALPKELA